MGVYTNLELTAPEIAEEGTLVNVIARVQNLTGSSKYITVTGKFDSAELNFSPSYLLVGEHKVGEFSADFYMPNRAVRVSAGSWYLYEAPDKWALDDQDYVDIALPPEEYAGTISKMELEYDEARGDIPVSNVPQGQRGLVHIWGRNDTGKAQQLGISWMVRDPDGLIPANGEYSHWEAWPYTGAGQELRFTGGRFDLNKAGTYLLDVGLFMNRDDPVMVDEYRGVLCTTVPVVPEPEFRGFALTEYVML